MESHSLERNWPIIKSRLAKAGLKIIPPTEQQLEPHLDRDPED